MNVRGIEWLAVVVATAGAVACSSGGSSPTGTGGSGGAAGNGGATHAAGTSGNAGTTGTAGTNGDFINPGVCGERGMATATTTAYDGTAEFYIIGDAGLGDDVCVVQYDVKRTGAAPGNCMDPTTGTVCTWSHLVTFSNPTIVTNVNGACDASNSVPQLDAAGRAQINGMMVGRGFSKVAGHGDSLMKYDGTKWTVVGHASWDMTSGSVGYDIRTGNCNYGR